MICKSMMRREISFVGAGAEVPEGLRIAQSQIGDAMDRKKEKA